MRRKRIFIVLAACVLVGIGVFAFWPGEKEPDYNGKKLSEWLALQNDHPAEVTEAVRAIGTNGLPVLIRWAEYQVPGWRNRLHRVYARFPRPLYRPFVASCLGNQKEQMRAFNSVFAFSKLGGDASAAAPELSRFVREVRYRDRRCAAWALGYIGGSEALAALLAAVRDERTPAIQRASIGGAIPHLNYRGPELTNAVPVMIACLRETNQFVPSIAASALGAFLIQPEQCVPALAEAIDSPNFRLQLNALRALGDFGPNAATAIKAISKALDDPERVVREEATNALQKIAPEVLTNGVKDF